MNHLRRGTACAALVGALYAGLAGAEPVARNRFEVAPAASPIAVDGSLDEAAWAAAARVPLTHEWFPGDNTPPPVATECLVTFDAERLYVAFRAADPDPSAIRAYFADRDVAFQDDTVGFLIDTFADRRRAYQFRVNALGVQMDSTVSDVDGTENWTWDAIWASAGRRNADGYTVEIAVPFKQLRYPSGTEVQEWGFLATRDYPRSVAHQLRSSANDRSLNCKVCQFDRLVGFVGTDTGHNVEVVPTLTGRRTDRRTDLAGPLERGSEDAEAGLSARWSITPNVALNAAVNPDFSQVEADTAQLDVNERFTLSYPEKRPFFLEAADVFSTPLRAVFTRTVADPEGGLKLTGKSGAGTFGAFAASDRINNLLLPGAESSQLASIDQDVASGVVRYRRDVGRTSTLGLLYAGRQAEGYDNHVLGVDGSLRLTASDTLRFQVLGSATDYPDAFAAQRGLPGERFDGDAWRFDYSRSTRNWFVLGQLYRLDDDFRADSGFIPQVGVGGLVGAVQRIFWGAPDRWFSRFVVQLDSNRIETTGGDELEQSGNLVLSYQGPLQTAVTLGLRPNRETFRGETFDNFRRDLRVSVRPTGLLRLEIFLRGGEIIDFANVRQSDFELVQPRVEFQVGPRFAGFVDHTWQSFRVRGDEFLRANLTQTTLRYHLSARTFVRAILQYREVVRDLDLFAPGTSLPESEESLLSQLLFSHKINPQTVLFVGYSDNQLGTGEIDLTPRDRTYFVKLGYALLW